MPEFRRSLPARPDLDQQKTQAKELLQAFRAGAPEARARMRAELPDKRDIVLADAQYVLAREYGFASWAALKQHIEGKTGQSVRPLERMRAAIERGDARQMRQLLAEHAELRALINEPLFSFDSPALVHFSGGNNVEIIDVLLEFGADPNRKTGWWAGGFHPLHGASPAVAERLLAAGAVPDACAAAHLDRPDLLAQMIADDPARVHERGGDGQLPLHFARSRKVIDMLLAAGADPDARDIDHRATAAQWMLDHRRGRGRYDLAAYLVERGATADIFLAAALGLNDRVRALVQADPAQLDLRTTQGEYGEQPPSSYHIYMWTIGANLSPLQVAQQFEQSSTFELLRTMASPRQRLLSALAQGDAREARTLLQAQPRLLDQLNAEDRRVLPEAGWAGNARAVALMLELGFDPQTPDGNGATVLHCAAFEGAADCVEVILRHPAAAQLVNRREPTHNATPFGWCTHGSCHGPRRGQHGKVARMLLAAGARPDRPIGDASDEVREIVDGVKD
jgi:ankyrin repeat protein